MGIFNIIFAVNLNLQFLDIGYSIAAATTGGIGVWVAIRSSMALMDGLMSQSFNWAAVYRPFLFFTASAWLSTGGLGVFYSISQSVQSDPAQFQKLSEKLIAYGLVTKELDKKAHAKYTALLEAKRAKEGTFSMDVAGIGEGFMDIWIEIKYLAKQSFNYSNWAVQLFSGGFTYLVKVCIEYLREFILGFLICVAPLALFFSVIPGFDSLRQQWLSRWLNLTCWSITISILEYLYLQSADTILGQTAAAAQSLGLVSSSYGEGMEQIDILYAEIQQKNFEFIVANFVLCVMYCMVPFLTSFYTNAESTGQMLTKVGGAVAGVAAMAVSAGTGAVSSVYSAGATDAQKKADRIGAGMGPTLGERMATNMGVGRDSRVGRIGARMGFGGGTGGDKARQFRYQQQANKYARRAQSINRLRDNVIGTMRNWERFT